MILEVSSLSPIIAGDAEFQPANHAYFCASCGKHREEFKPSECLRIFKLTPTGKIFAGFYCGNCFSIGAPKEQVRYCVECNVLPAAHPSTDLCNRCAPVPDAFLKMLRSEKLSVLIGGLS